MTLKIKKLGNEDQVLLNLAACIGNSFDLKTLSIVAQKNDSQVFDELNDALSTGLIISKNTIHKQSDSQSLSNRQFKFSHDRIQQAAYSLLPESERKKVHYQIGQLLLQESKQTEMDENIFDIVNQLNVGIELIQDQSEKKKMNWHVSTCLPDKKQKLQQPMNHRLDI